MGRSRRRSNSTSMAPPLEAGRLLEQAEQGGSGGLSGAEGETFFNDLFWTLNKVCVNGKVAW